MSGRAPLPNIDTANTDGRRFRLVGDAIGLTRAALAVLALAIVALVGIVTVALWQSAGNIERAVLDRLGFPPADIAPPSVVAEPMTPPRAWIAADDYPAEAVANDLEGVVAVELIVDPHGVARRCVIDKSSGSSILDAAACKALLRQARFTAARDGRGRPTWDRWHRRVAWRLPK